MTKDTVVEEAVKEFEGHPTPPDLSYMSEWLRNSLERAWEAGERSGIEKTLGLVEEHDPNVSMGRDTSPAYWGNTLRKAITDLLTPPTKEEMV